MTTKQTRTSSKETPVSEREIDLEAEAKKPHVPSDLHLHFDMPADSQAGMAEEIAHRYCKKYFGDIEYRMSLETVAIMIDGRIAGYRVTLKARKWIDYGEW